MQLSKWQKIFISTNGGACVFGSTAFNWNGLVHGSNLIDMWTGFPGLHNLQLGDIYLTHYHFDDDSYVEKIDNEYNIWKPTAERVLIDAVEFVDKSYDEGVFIEAMQNYLRMNKDLSKLYSVADHYNVPHSKVDYWITEALEESDMSMG